MPNFFLYDVAFVHLHQHAVICHAHTLRIQHTTHTERDKGMRKPLPGYFLIRGCKNNTKILTDK